MGRAQSADGESGLQYYLPSHVSLANGTLQLLTSTARCSACCASTSAAVQVKSFTFTYGTVETRAKMPGGGGNWPAVWLLGHDCQASNVTSPANV